MLSGNPPIRVEYSRGPKGTQAADFDLLIVACDPRQLPMQKTAVEMAVFSRLTNFTFHTYALKVNVPVDRTKRPIYGIILKPPGGLSDMEGQVYGFRNESAKQFTLDAANAMDENLVVVYRLWSADSVKTSFDQDVRELRKQLSVTPWWPYGDDFSIVGTLRTPYFDHFDVDAVNDKLPWQYLGLQGDNATIYVHASTCFEAVLTCDQYIDLLFRPKADGGHGVTLPLDRAARIGVIGAGVSGILVTLKLAEMGYGNVTILERELLLNGRDSLIYGKTHSVVFDDPKPPPGLSPYNGPTVCELGTCYMSPSYDALVAKLQKLSNATPPRGFEVGHRSTADFRGIVSVQPGGGQPVVPFTKYVMDAARAHLAPGLTDNEVRDCILIAAGDYIASQTKIMGSTLPMPLAQPRQPAMSQTFAEFLDTPLLRVLNGIFEYSYSIQGYGPLDAVSAFYGLTWMSTVLVVGEILESAEGESLVTFWPDGWGAIWRVLCANMSIIDGATVTAITRATVGSNDAEGQAA